MEKTQLYSGKGGQGSDPGGDLLGIAEDLSEDGSLMVKRENGLTESVVVGDVSIRSRT